MKYPWIDEYLLSKRHVEKDLKKEWNWIRYMIRGKLFAAVLLDDDDRPYYINVKTDPAESVILRGSYPDIIPGYYSNKEHWNSIKADGEVPDELVRHLLDEAYDLILHSFSKKKQRELAGEE